MIKLQNLHVQLTKPCLKESTKKYLRVSVENIVNSTINPATIKSDTSMEWDEPISLPVLYKREFLFEIYDKHEFGYNPDELTVMHGIIIIDNPNQTNNRWEILNQHKKSIGFLSAKIKNQKITTKQPVMNPEDPQKLRIKSIVAHLPKIKYKKGYIKIDIADRSVRTETVRSNSGELVFTDPMEIEKFATDQEAIVSLHSVEHNMSEIVLGTGQLNIESNKPPKKVVIRKNNEEIGQVFIDSKVIPKNKTKKAIIRRSIDLTEESLQKPSKKATKSIDFTRLQHFGISNSRLSKPILNYSQISSTSQKKRVSVVGGNGDILFPRERRFMIYQDRQTDRITYLNDRSFQFRDRTSKQYYRGASFGYGGKTDFSREGKKSPGVGNYQLPSIWDRY